MGFTGAIFSDDLSMEGASVAGNHTQGAVAALNAGCDMVLLCNQSLNGGQAVDELLDGLTNALARGEWELSPDSEARRLDLLPQTAPFPWGRVDAPAAIPAGAGQAAALSARQLTAERARARPQWSPSAYIASIRAHCRSSGLLVFSAISDGTKS